MINPDDSMQRSHPNSSAPQEDLAEYLAGENIGRINDSSSLRDRQLRAFFEGAIDAMVIVDDTGRYLDANPAAYQLFGVSEGNLLGRTFNDFLQLQSDCNFIDQWQSLQQEQRITGEFSLQRLDGTMRNIEYSATANFLPHRHLAVLRDVTERKQLERELAALNADLERWVEQRTLELNYVLQNVSGVVASFRYYSDRTSEVDFISPNCHQVYGYSVQEFLADTDLWILQVHSDDRDRVLTQMDRTIYEGGHTTVDYRFYHKDGRLRWISETFISCHDPDLNCWRVVTIGMDVTHLKQDSALQLQAQREHTLSQFLQMIRESLDLSILLPAAAAAIGQLSKADRVEIVQYHPDLQLWRNISDYRRNPELPSALGIEIPDAGNEIATRLKRREIVRIDDASQIPDAINPPLAQQFPGSWLLVPIQMDEMIWGAVSLVNHQRHASWENVDVELLVIVANQLAIAIQQAQLQTQLRQLNLTLKQQVQTHRAELQAALFFETALKRLTDSVRDSLEHGEILQTVVEELALTLDVWSCDIAFYNDDYTTSTIHYDYTTSFPSAQGQVIQMSEFLDGYAQLLRGEYLYFCRYSPHSSNLRPGITQTTIFACPLIDDRRVLGDLWLYKPAQSYFNDLEIRLIRQVANQCAIALRQARLYQQSQAYARELEHLNQHKDDLLTTVTHELRAPMTNIKMAAQMLEMLIKTKHDVDDKTARYFQILRQECDRETNLIDDLLDLARIESGQLQLNCTSIDLSEFLVQVAAPFEQRMAEQDQVFQLCITPNLPMLTTDVTYLQRVLSELLHNACKYTPAEEQIILTAQSISELVNNQPDFYLLISVTNTGVEIPPQEQRRIFEKFYRIPGQDYRRAGGTGLGLALIEKLTLCLGGFIELISGDRRTTFNLKFPDHSIQI